MEILELAGISCFRLLNFQSLLKIQSVCYESPSVQTSDSQAVYGSGVLKTNNVL